MNKGNRRILEEMRNTKVSIEFTGDEILFINTILGCFGDGRDRLTKIILKRFTPVANKLLAEHKEWN